MKPDHKTLMPNSNFGSTTNQSNGTGARCVGKDFCGNTARGLVPQDIPTYSAFLGDGEFNNVSNNISVENNHR